MFPTNTSLKQSIIFVHIIYFCKQDKIRSAYNQSKILTVCFVFIYGSLNDAVSITLYSVE
jgi:hypothetical protein